MPENDPPIYLVDATSSPVLIKIKGRAGYLNCSPLAEFFKRLMAKGVYDFVLDCGDCLSMDSTFLGMLAGVGLELEKASHSGSLVLCKLSERNLVLIRNLGLYHILKIDTGNFRVNLKSSKAVALDSASEKSIASARLMLKAHKDLVSVNAENKLHFQNVIDFLKKETAQDT